jgi:hypothetical protein
MADTQYYLKGPLNDPIHFTLLEFFEGSGSLTLRLTSKVRSDRCHCAHKHI